MPFAARPVSNTTPYALIDQRSYRNYGTAQATDVLARRERYTTAASTSELRLLAVQLCVDGQLSEFTYQGSESSMPSWASPVLQSLAERWGAFEGWDSYEAKPTNPQLVARLLNILSGLMEEPFLTPTTTPLADGGIQAEWHHRGKDLEIVVPANENPTYYYFDSATGEEQEGDLNSDYAKLRDLIDRVSHK